MEDGFGEADRRSFVLVASYGRSGSTVLQALLGSIPGWCIRGENYHALSGLYDSHLSAGRARAEFGERETPFDNPWHGSGEIQPTRYGRRLADVFVDEVLAPPDGTRVVGFKEIRVFHRVAQVDGLLDFVREFLEPTRIVFLRRGWEEVSRSSWWNAVDPTEVREYVERCDELMTSYAHQHPATCFIVEHHHLESNSYHVDDLLDFIGERPSPDLVASILSKRLSHGKRSGRLAAAGHLPSTEMVGHPERADRHGARLVRIGRWLIAIGRNDADAPR